MSGQQFSHGRNVKECERKIREMRKLGRMGARLTHTAVIHSGIVNPALRLLNLSFQMNSRLCRPAVGHSFVGLGLQVLQSCCDLFSQSSGFRSVTSTPKRNLRTAKRSEVVFYHKGMAKMRSVNDQLQLERK